MPQQIMAVVIRRRREACLLYHSVHKLARCSDIPRIALQLSQKLVGEGGGLLQVGKHAVKTLNFLGVFSVVHFQLQVCRQESVGEADLMRLTIRVLLPPLRDASSTCCPCTVCRELVSWSHTLEGYLCSRWSGAPCCKWSTAWWAGSRPNNSFRNPFRRGTLNWGSPRLRYLPTLILAAWKSKVA